MARPVRELPVTTALVPMLLRFAAEHGAAVPEIVTRWGLPDDAATATETAVPPDVLRALFDAVADASGEPWVGLRLAAADASTSAKYAPLELAVRASRTLGDALVCLARFAPLLHPTIRADVVADEAGLAWRAREGRPRAGGMGRHADEYVLATVLARCREATTDYALRAATVTFAHARPRDLAPLQRFFGTASLVFGADTNSLTLPADQAERSLPTGDPRLLATALDLAAGQLARDAPAQRTTALLKAKLPELLRETPTLASIARALAMSERTLQRRLEAEGTTFLDVQDEVREASARALLHDSDVSLVEVAERLGFADLATFSRAFKRWTGHPPGMFRRRVAG